MATAAAQHCRKVYYGKLLDLIASLEDAEASGDLARRLRVLTHPGAGGGGREVGYLPVTRHGATLFFQLIAARYERCSTVLASSGRFEEWSQFLGDEMMAT